MSFSLSNRALLLGILAGGVVLAGTACSRSDRTESGSDNGAAVLPDTAGYRSMERDTTNVPGQHADSASSATMADETADEQIFPPGDQRDTGTARQ